MARPDSKDNRDRRDRRDRRDQPQEVPEFQERVVFINRVAKVVKGGRRFSFSALSSCWRWQRSESALVWVKLAEVPEAIRKGVEDAKKEYYFRSASA